MSSEERKNSLAAAFGIESDELRPKEPTLGTARPKEEPQKELGEVEVSPGIVRLGAHEYVQNEDGQLEPVNNLVQINFTVSAKERHLLRRLAKEERRSLVSYLREILEARGLL